LTIEEEESLLLQGLDPGRIAAVLLPIAALFGATAIVFQLLMLTVRTLVSRLTARSGCSADHPDPESRAQSSWRGYLRALGWRLAVIAVLLWAFAEFRLNYLELLDEGQLGPILTLARRYLLALSILAFLKASLYVAAFLVLLPLLLVWSNRSRADWFKQLVGFGTHHAPKAVPLLIYYGLLVVTISLVTNPGILAQFPFHMPWETFGRLLQQDITLHLVELKNLLLKLVSQ
jgi:hypothetical protein